jgi:hypothetical protein
LGWSGPAGFFATFAGDVRHFLCELLAPGEDPFAIVSSSAVRDDIAMNYRVEEELPCVR